MTNRKFNVLYICTGNSARSIMAEVITNRLGNGRFQAFSAGSHPRGQVHEMTLEVLGSQGYDLSGLRSKSWSEFAGAEAPQMDFIFTVCDQAAGEVCPAWPGQPITAHWGFPDPVAVQGDRAIRLKAFTAAQTSIANRIRLLMNLPIDKLERLALQEQLRQLGSRQND